ncbi:lysophospholipid acyltransferase family protein [Elioraea sp.]|uniref:lysophospholipid acyltransferase family protein n=1 Tax=Elioraea sp. TaxID=2185103 RepID=UPI003F6E44C1
MLKRLLRHPRALALGAAAIAAWLRLVHRTTRWRIEGREHVRAVWESGIPAIGAFWHDQLPLMVFTWTQRFPGERGPGAMRCIVLVSRHRDGRLIGDVISRLGVEALHGSTARGGFEAFRELQRLLAEGHSVVITPDGPRGPRRVAQPGVARLAALTGAKVLPLGVAVSRRKVLETWDRVAIPLPFGRGAMVYGAPVAVAPDADGPAVLAEIAAAMDAAAARAEALVQGRA